jgi:hypothetical protein
MNRSTVLAALAAIGLPFGTAGVTLAEGASPAPGSQAAAEVVGREVVAYNAHDAAAVTKLHAPNATFTLLPDGKIIASGADQLLALFTQNFKAYPNVQLILEKQFVLQTVVVNHYTVKGGSRPEILSIYEVQDDVIANEWLIRG